MSQGVPHALAAVYQVVYAPLDAADIPQIDEVTDDLEAEGETLPDDAEPDEDEHLLEASKGVTSETDKDYKRLMRRCLEFLKEKGLITANDKFLTNVTNAERKKKQCIPFNCWKDANR
ncbi:hypothetical protein B0H14DRAFT_2601902 [Mycena olivaceomarginata]|nr:hypothetical protein B0H14DRAFT_2601902 [Mycena olivaceomarginata]